jgi:hypothetical protein
MSVDAEGAGRRGRVWDHSWRRSGDQPLGGGVREEHVLEHEEGIEREHDWVRVRQVRVYGYSVPFSLLVTTSLENRVTHQNSSIRRRQCHVIFVASCPLSRL